jgi:hypothetical protein
VLFHYILAVATTGLTFQEWGINMIKVSIFKQGVETHSGQFATQGEVDAWIAQETLKMSWGKVAGQYFKAQLSSDEYASKTAETDVGPNGEPLQDPLVTIPDQFVIAQSDISAQVAHDIAVEKGKACQDFGAKVIATVWALNEGKNLSSTDFQAILADATLATVERLLWSGSLKTARAVIASYSGTAFSAAEKAAVLAMIDGSGLV